LKKRKEKLTDVYKIIHFIYIETGNYMGIPRSRLYVIALEEYIAKHNGEMITQKLNEVYSKIDQSEFDRDLEIGLESLRDLTKNNTW